VALRMLGCAVERKARNCEPGDKMLREADSVLGRTETGAMTILVDKVVSKRLGMDTTLRAYEDMFQEDYGKAAVAGALRAPVAV